MYDQSYLTINVLLTKNGLKSPLKKSSYLRKRLYCQVSDLAKAHLDERTLSGSAAVSKRDQTMFSKKGLFTVEFSRVKLFLSHYQMALVQKIAESAWF